MLDEYPRLRKDKQKSPKISLKLYLLWRVGEVNVEQKISYERIAHWSDDKAAKNLITNCAFKMILLTIF